ncbi:MAG: cyanophycinase [Solirubrobacteraceae bacterium]|jgi:cyanophycinase|nr:cyanophycinase [Solirubrobacteraceae bacterium]
MSRVHDAPVFLIGGGRDAAAVLAVHRPFTAALAGDGPVACIVLDEGDDTDRARWEGNLRDAGAADVRTLVVSASRPLTAPDLDGVAGVYVAGGHTPGYQEALAGAGLPAVPYAGFSAGAAIAGERALVGGWRARIGEAEVAVVDDGAGEDLELIEVRDGLGLVTVLADVHAAQWGTLGRLVHAVRTEDREGWAIDEGTALELRGGEPVAVHGLGAAARVRPAAGGEVTVRMFAAGPLG